MNRIEKMIAELCSNGVKFKALKEIAIYSRVRIPSAILCDDTYVGVDNLLPEMQGKISSTYTPSAGTSIGYELGDILIGNIRPYLKKIWLADSLGGTNQDVLVVRIRKEERIAITPQFLYYTLASYDFFSYNMRYAKGAKMPRGDKKAIMRYRIPIPPLEIQHEIVNILDKFTELEAELEAELESRRKQYEYYRDQLLSFEPGYRSGICRIDKLIAEQCPGEVEWRNLETLGSIYGGLTGKRKADFGVGNARFITYKDIFNKISADLTANNFVRVASNEKQNNLEVGDVFFTASSETLEEVGMSSVVIDTPSEDIFLNSFCFGFRFNNRALLTPGFSKYVFRSNVVRKQIIRTASGVTRFNISKKRFLKRVRIPIPPLEIQHEVVNILDKFNALVNDLSTELPAEINARRKQYEYYRDQLLTFKEAA